MGWIRFSFLLNRKDNLLMGKHINIPGWLKIHNYLSVPMLGSIKTLAWLATDLDNSPLAEQIQDYFPEDQRETFSAALREIGILAQDALKKHEKQEEKRRS